MDQTLKERLVGATVLVILAVVFIPMLLNETDDEENEITRTIIPPKPESDFSSRIIPLEDETNDKQPITSIKKDIVKKAPIENIKEKPVPPVVEEKKMPDMVSEKKKPTDLNVGLNAWVVQLGSFSSEANAQALNKKLRNAGYPAFVDPLKQKSAVVYRVRVGPELKRSDAQSIRDAIKKSMKLDGIVISYP
jgi:DedD protein